jgi:hypothetical protein
MMGRRVLLAAALLAAAMELWVSDAALAHGHRDTCTVATLDGLYVFTATGFTTISPATTPTSPKAIVELIRFNGDGTVGVPGGTVSVNGQIFPTGGTGSYTVADLVPPDRICTGTLTFLPSGPHFNLFIPLDAKEVWMIQTDQGNVFQGTATKVSH